MAPLLLAFYGTPCGGRQLEWADWVRSWAAALAAAGADHAEVRGRMLAANPKYVPREWQLVKVYRAAAEGNYEPMHQLHAVLERPYDEQPEREAEYFARAPPEEMERAGTAFMT